jgi:excisionase family DNA binding protein
MSKNLITIKQAAEMIGVTITTLRRWDESGKLVAVRLGKGSHRLYRMEDIEIFATDLFSSARLWASATEPTEPQDSFYCPTSYVFQARLNRMETEMLKRPDLQNTLSIISSVAGEIGNNSFDHNLGSWFDIAGIFFAYDLNKKVVVLADRGQGILRTLQRVKKDLKTHDQALKTAFTEVITGRAPEHRGNGLKYVRRVVTGYPVSLFFQTGDAKLRLQKGDTDIKIEKAEHPIHGCLALIRF